MRWKTYLLCVATIAAFGCGGGTDPDDEFVLTMSYLAGLYYATTFTTEESGVVTDELRLGASIQLILFGDGITSGRLIIPPDTSGCCAADVALNGTWELEGNTVTLSQAEDTFLNGMLLVFENTHLTGEATRDGVMYRVVLAL